MQIIDALSQAIKQGIDQGSATAVIFAFLFGVFVGFTPCVYPVLPITVSFIGRLSGGGRLRGFYFSLIYVVGMALVNASVGIITALAGEQLGALWNRWWVLFILGNFFLLLAFWQLGLIKIPMPAFISARTENKKGAIGALAVGAASGFVVGPCTLPGLAAMAVLITSSVRSGNIGAVAFGATMMFAYSLGLGSLVIICGTFSGFIANLPKSGRWLGVVEKVFAILMIIAAEFFLIYMGQNTDFPLLVKLFVID